jgi:glycosyltransferase involved in cell wall biosynthesis
MSHLAIIIPAYKKTFLERTLESIASQTCKDFTLYIGDDSSPYNLESIVKEYQDKIDIVYKRFDSNFGGTDLVAQWERCVDMNQGEEWLWLFSDDDVMEPQCVEEFYEIIKEHPDAGLIHFNIARLESSTGKIFPVASFPRYCLAKMYLDEKVKGHFISMVVEFVVRRDIFLKNGRFQNFDLAWGSDFCSWVKFSHAADGIWTCPKAKVLWRESNENISPDTSNQTVFRKLNSVIKYVKWLTDFTSQRNYGHIWFYGKYVIGEIRRNRKRLSKAQYRELVDTYELVNGWPWLVRIFTLLLFYI